MWCCRQAYWTTSLLNSLSCSQLCVSFSIAFTLTHTRWYWKIGFHNSSKLDDSGTLRISNSIPIGGGPWVSVFQKWILLLLLPPFFFFRNQSLDIRNQSSKFKFYPCFPLTFWLSFTGSLSKNTTLKTKGILDLGGGSTQITFAPSQGSTIAEGIPSGYIKQRNFFGKTYQLYTHR